jgi:hypothetical protein
VAERRRAPRIRDHLHQQDHDHGEHHSQKLQRNEAIGPACFQVKTFCAAYFIEVRVCR